MSLSLSAQQFAFRHYTTADGLPHSSVWRLVQDKDGTLWMGTANGLVHFDGQTFKNYSTKDGLYGRSITSVVLSEEGHLLATAYQKGVNSVKDGKIESLYAKSSELRFGETACYKGDTLLIPRSNSLAYILPDGTIKVIPHPDNYFYKCHCNKESVLLGMENGLFEFKNEQLLKVPFPDTSIKDVRAYFKDSYGNIWLGGTQKIWRIDSNQQVKTFEVDTNNEVIHDLLVDSKNRIWLSVINEGLYQLKEGKAHFVGDEYELGKTQVNDFWEDKEKNVWMTTFGKGVICLYNTPFENFTESHGLSNHIINSLYYEPQSRNLFIGTFDKLNVFKNEKFEAIPLKDDEQGLQYIRDINSNGLGDLFVNSSGFNPLPFLVQNYQGINIYQTRWFYAWTIWQDSLLIKKRKSDKISYIHKKYTQFSTEKEYHHIQDLKGNRTLCILVEDSKNIWLGTEEGLYKVDTNATVLQNIDRNKTLPKILQKERINVIKKDKEGNIWVGTSEGLARWNGHEWKIYSEKTGLKNDMIRAMTFDENNHLWLGTSGGLVYFDGQNFEIYSEAEGLIANEINALAYDYHKKQLWIGTTAGLSKLDINHLKEYQKSLFSNLKINQLISNDTTYQSFENIEIPYPQNDLRIQYQATYFQNPNGISYEYRLIKEGMNQENTWKTTTENEVFFNRLEAGNYTFQLKANALNATWKKPIELNFLITKALWQRTFYQTLFAFFVVKGIIFIAWRRIKYVRREEQEKRNLIEHVQTLEQQALYAMMNPHFIFNALNSIQHYMNSNNSQEANEYLAKFAHLIRLNMDLSSQNTITLEDELERLHLYLELEELRFGEDFSWEIKVSKEVDVYEKLVPSMVIQPYVENAIWHGLTNKEGKGVVTIDIFEEEKQLHILIKDNGIGLTEGKLLKQQKESIYDSKGMKITQERIELFGRKANHRSSVEVVDILNELDKVQGTKVHIRLVGA